MKSMIVFLAILNSCSFFPGLKQNKLNEALQRAQFEQNRDNFFYSLTEFPPEMRQKSDELDRPASLPGIYGPYQLTLRGIEPGTRFNLYHCNLLDAQDPLLECSGYIDQSGEAWVKKKEGDLKLSSSLYTFGGLLPGEPLYSVVVLEDKKTYIGTCIIPKPLEVYGKQGRHVTMQFFTHQEPLYMVCGEHFNPEEEITFLFHYSTGVGEDRVKVSKDGSFMVMMEGDPSKKPLETQTMQIFSAEQDDPMTLSYNFAFLNANKERIKDKLSSSFRDLINCFKPSSRPHRGCT